jgi:teichuronic acid exporter
MEDLKDKTIRSSIWTFLESGLVFIVEFVFNIILARLLTPHDYGIYGILMIFIIISRVFVSSGLGEAIVREKNTTDSDLSTVFYANLSASIFIYLILFFTSIFFVGFFEVENLSLYIKIISLVLIVDAFTIIQRTILTKELNFKKQTILNTISVTIAGATGIFLAYNGYGVWSLIFKILIHYTLLTILLWITSNWKPRLIFDWIAFKRLFNFSYKLLLSGLLNQFYNTSTTS